MANSEVAMEEQEKQNLEETIEGLEIELDNKDEEIDSLNTEILELQKELNALRSGSDSINRELISFQASLLNIVRNMDGILESDFLRYAHHFVHKLRSDLESNKHVRRECDRKNTPDSLRMKMFSSPRF